MNNQDKAERIASKNPAVDLAKLKRNLAAVESLSNQGFNIRGQHRLPQPYVGQNKPDSQKKSHQQPAKPAFAR